MARHNRRVRFALLDDSKAVVLGGKLDGAGLSSLRDACARSWGSALLQLSDRRRRVAQSAGVETSLCLALSSSFRPLAVGSDERSQLFGRHLTNDPGSCLPAATDAPYNQITLYGLDKAFCRYA